MKQEAKIKIGIDPDVTKNGVAFKDGELIELLNLSFFKLFDFLSFYQEKENKPTIYIECGFLNGSNWHVNRKQSNAISSKIGERVGANFEVAKKIIEMCEYLGLPYLKVKPTRSKVDSVYFKKITGIEKRTNQEQRDAYMLIH